MGGRARTGLEGDGCAMDVPCPGVDVALALSPSEIDELRTRAEATGVSIDDVVTALVRTSLTRRGGAR